MQRRQVGGEFVLRGAPRGVARINLGEVPLELVRRLRAVAALGTGVTVNAISARAMVIYAWRILA